MNSGQLSRFGQGLILLAIFSSVGGRALGQGKGNQEPGKRKGPWVVDPREDLNAKFPLAPPELIARYIKEAKADQHYAFADALRVDQVRAASLEWSKDLGVHLEVKGSPFLRLLARGSSVRTRVAEPGQLRLLEEVFLPTLRTDESGIWRSGPNISILALRVEGEAGEEPRVYRVEPGSMEELSFEVATRLGVISPFNVVQERYSAKGVSLGQVVEELCLQAGVEEIAFRTDLADEAKVRLELRNRTIRECLDLAARVAGLTVRYNGSKSPSDRWIELRDIEGILDKRLLLQELERSPEGSIDPLEILRSKVEHEAERVRHVIVILEPTLAYSGSK